MIFKQFEESDIIRTQYKVTKSFTVEFDTPFIGDIVQLDEFKKPALGSPLHQLIGYAIININFNNPDPVYVGMRRVNLKDYNNFTIVLLDGKFIGDTLERDSIDISINDGQLNLTDDGNGNIVDENDNLYGYIVYEHGIILLMGIPDINFSTSTINWTAIKYRTETQVIVRIDPDEFNDSYNPTFNPELHHPYITTIGLYDDENRLIATAKLSKPVPKKPEVPLTFIIKFDNE